MSGVFLRDMCTDEWKKFVLRFPGGVHCGEFFQTDADDFDWFETSARAFAAVLAVYFAQQLVTTSGDLVVVNGM